jgi:DnaJ domain
VTVLIGLVALVIVLWGLNVFTHANVKFLAQGAKGAKVAGGTLALAGAAFLAFRGQLFSALPLGIAGLALLGLGPAGFGQRTQKSADQVSRVRSAFLEMELEHDTGAMRGRVIAGPHAGTPLEALNVATLGALLGEIDDESRALLLAYLDRREPGWRENAENGAAAGERSSWGSGKMTEQEAYEILGLQPGAGAEDIGHAHRALMKKLHPDQGGSTYLAARVNEAKDILLRRHR